MNNKSKVSEALESTFIGFWAAALIALSIFGWGSEVLTIGEFVFCEVVAGFTLFYCIYRFNKVTN